MRILQVVSIVDDDATCGGPLAIALNQCAELRRRGHDARILAGWGGAGEPPSELEGIPAHLFRVARRGPVGRLSMAMTSWLRRHAEDHDVAHLHFSRDLTQLTVAAVLDRAGVPYLVQTHGVVQPLGGRTARWLDEVLSVPALRRAAARLVADPSEQQAIVEVTGTPLGITHVPAGIVLPDTRERTPVAGTVDVLFLGRVGAARGAMVFAEVAAQVLGRGVDARFAVVGPDAGELAALTTFVRDTPELRGRLRYEGALPHAKALQRLRKADLMVVPGQGGGVSMAVLEALAHGVPTVCTTGYPHAITLRARRAAKVVKPTTEALAAAVADLAADPLARSELGRRGRLAALRAFDITPVVDELERLYDAAVTHRGALDAGVRGPLTSVRTDHPHALLPGPRSVADTAARPAARGAVRPAAGADEQTVGAGLDLDGAKSLLWVATEVTPYRLALWREVAQLADLTVGLLAPSQANWRLQLSGAGEPFRVVPLNAPSVPGEHGVPLFAPTRSLRVLVRTRPDAVVLDGWESPAFLKAARWARRLDIPVVATYRGTRAGGADEGGAARARRGLRRRVDAVVPDALDLGFLGRPVPPAAQAVGTLPRQTAPEGVVDLRDGHHFVFVGDLIARKNVDALLRAFHLARGLGDILTIAGSGPLQGRLVALAVELGVDDAVVFVPVGSDDERRGTVRSGQTLVLPSTDEIWSTAVDEALGAGLHAVVSTAVGLAEQNRHRAGVFLADPSPDSLARALMASRQTWAARAKVAAAVAPARRITLPDASDTPVPAGRS